LPIPALESREKSSFVIIVGDSTKKCGTAIFSHMLLRSHTFVPQTAGWQSPTCGIKIYHFLIILQPAELYKVGNSI